jgi:Ca-activated chloride channel family protein
MSLRAALLSAILVAHPAMGVAQSFCNDDAMIVFDGSGSMSFEDFNSLDAPRITEARQALRSALPRIAANRRLGLVIYGPGQGESCANVDLRFGPTSDASDLIMSEVDTLNPSGMTALTEGVRKAAEALDYRVKPATVVLVTDGQETCGGAPCDLADEMIAQAENLTVHIIGFQLRANIPTFRVPGMNPEASAEKTTVAKCLAEKTGGHYLPAENVEELAQALERTLGCRVYGLLEKLRIL